MNADTGSITPVELFIMLESLIERGAAITDVRVEHLTRLVPPASGERYPRREASGVQSWMVTIDTNECDR